MFERLTDRARKVFALANQESQRFNHEYIGTEHVLLALVKEGRGLGAFVIKNLGIDLRKVRLEVEKLIKDGPDMVTMGKLPMTPATKKVVEYANKEAQNLTPKYVGTEHLLLGLVCQEEGIARQVLSQLGVEYEKIRKIVAQYHHEGLTDARPMHVDTSTAHASAENPFQLNMRPMTLLIDPGSASAEELGELLFELSSLYRQIGGSGISFTIAESREPQLV